MNSVSIGSQVDAFSFLGRSTSSQKSPLDYQDLGISLDYEDNGTVSGFQIVLKDPDGRFAGFDGTIQLNGSSIDPGQLLQDMGESYWLDRDEDELLHFYEYPTHEIQIEQKPSGEIERVIATKLPVMADPEQRRSYGVDKPWPPF